MKKIAKLRGSAEKVMAVRRDDIFRDGEWDGLNDKDFMKLLDVVRQRHVFLSRWDIEDNPMWQQIIPFGVFVSQKHVFSYVKAERSSEKRLVGERLVGIAGHLRQSDIVDYGSLLQWFEREWNEEIRYEGSPFIWPIGVIHDVSRPVSACHLGFAFLLYGSRMSLRVRAPEEEIVEAKFLPLDELDELRGQIDNWSIIVLDHLKKYRGLLAL